MIFRFTGSSLLCLGGVWRLLIGMTAAAMLWIGFLWATGRLIAL